MRLGLSDFLTGCSFYNAQHSVNQSIYCCSIMWYCDSYVLTIWSRENVAIARWQNDAAAHTPCPSKNQKPISSSKIARNLSGFPCGNGSNAFAENDETQICKSLREGVNQRAQTSCHEHTNLAVDDRRYPSFANASARSTWWLSNSVGLGTTIMGFPILSTSRIVPEPIRNRYEVERTH